MYQYIYSDEEEHSTSGGPLQWLRATRNLINSMLAMAGLNGL